MPVGNWTQEQFQMAVKYGTCPICKEPRTAWDIEDGILGQPETVTHTRKLVCSAEPIKHPQN